MSDKMDKTIVVAVSSIKIHAQYQKRFRTKKHYKVHDPKNEYHPGDTVIFEETRPLSKEKRWRVVAKA